ncbi:spore photoproduct lyase [Alkalibaculum sp. M08DMB]|uniref:Spore photoproduct lyase n=1 Tax=Alkalibaculum sporogenes TaxID=2655001 RepID=A0A6A7K4M4_9FIRM|nr:spore photoproduct lyase [Alkalibaculum sporogenes]
MFVPKRIIFEKDALNYSISNQILDQFKDKSEIELIYLNSNKYKHHIPGDNLPKQYIEGKKTLIVGKKKSLKFQTCKPSAHYQLPLVSGCMGQCEYCYLNTKLGDKPFTKIYVNLSEILKQANKYIVERSPDITIFEGAATSDPIPVEPYTNALQKTIEAFGANENARFRFVTKYNDIDSLLQLEHNDHTEIRFSINTSFIISQYEGYTASLNKRIEASVKVAKAGYPTGFLIAPVFIYENWEKEYHDLLIQLKQKLPDDLKHPLTFEIISHRYTTIAKNRILQVFPESKLPMEEDDRKFKYGQFGYGKYVYPKENIDKIKDFFSKEIEKIFVNKEIKYII